MRAEVRPALVLVDLKHDGVDKCVKLGMVRLDVAGDACREWGTRGYCFILVRDAAALVDQDRGNGHGALRAAVSPGMKFVFVPLSAAMEPYFTPVSLLENVLAMRLFGLIWRTSRAASARPADSGLAMLW